ncbi:MAG: hypothetical protein PHW63_03090 [Alphaproteobacteria bacterium]|nr:hypothetical protein [Alphaproteobacteria bacterium]
MSSVFSSSRLVLSLMIFFSVAIVGVRLDDLWDSMAKGKMFTTVQQVQASPALAAETASKDAPKKAEPAAAPTPAGPPKEEAKQEAPITPTSSSPESDLYRQLAGRRDQLDKRASELDSREALVSVAEKRIDQKLKEMETLKAQLEKLVGQAGAAQQAQLENLVKIYEIMKPKEAAKIFESLEMPVLLGVVQKMKPARTAAVMAEMNPEKAKEITIALTKQDQLPQVK